MKIHTIGFIVGKHGIFNRNAACSTSGDTDFGTETETIQLIELAMRHFLYCTYLDEGLVLGALELRKLHSYF